jgi:S-(hydroxymethyl)glutathione dehydrogenase / alcohol dehydrogenase
MKAAILVSQRQPLELVDLTLPALEYGQVLVRILATSICGSQLGEIDGVKGPDPYLPHALGHEAVGVVEEVGGGVRQVRPGQRVVLHWKPGAGLQAAPAVYSWGSARVNAGWVTTFQEQAIVSENRVTPVPDTIDLETAALYGCAITTGFGVINRDAAVRIGESVVVYGTGGVGLSVVLAAHLAGAYPVVAVDLVPERLELARSLGATHTVCASQADAHEQVRAALGGKAADVTVDNTGRTSVVEQAWQLTGPKGRCILVGVTPKGANVAVDPMPMHFGRVMKGSHGGDAVPHEDIPRYLAMQQAGRFDPSPMISHRFRLDQINEAIAGMRDGSVVRPLLYCGAT